MSAPRSLDPGTATYARWRLLRGYVASRRLPGYWLLMIILLGMVLWGREWGQEHAPTTLRMLVFLLPVATAAVIGVSLWSPFGEPERAAGTWLPLGRFLHLLTMLVFALLVNRIAVETWVPAGDIGQWSLYLLRHTVALIGVALLMPKMLDSRLSWIGPALVAMPGLVVGYIRVEQAEIEGRNVSFFYDSSTHLMLRPHDSLLAAGVAVGLFVMGGAITIRRGERLAGPDDTAG